MAVEFSEIENGFDFVSAGAMYEHSAFVNKETGEVFYKSEFGDSDELPEDIESDKYERIPHKNELDLGRELVFDFVSEHLPDELDRVYGFFRQRGAYTRFKDLLEYKGLLEAWYKFEDTEQKTALKEWCRDHEIEIIDDVYPGK